MQFQVNSFICELIHFMIPGWKAAVIKTDIRSWCRIMHGISPEHFELLQLISDDELDSHITA